MANNNICKELEELGQLYLKENITSMNEQNDYDMQESEAYKNFVLCYTKNKDNQEVMKIGSNYLFVVYAIHKLYSIYTKCLNDFDRQSLKLSSVLNDMYLIENNISKTTESNERIKKLTSIYQEKINELPGIETNIKQTASNGIIEEGKRYIENAEKLIEELRNNDDHISKNIDSEAVTGLIRIILQTFLNITNIEVLLEAIYKIFKLDPHTIKLESVFSLGSYAGVIRRTENLFTLAEDNKSVDKNFKESEFYLLLNDYTKLKDTVTNELINRQKDLITKEINEYLKLDKTERDLQGDIDLIVYQFMAKCQDNLKEELRW